MELTSARFTAAVVFPSPWIALVIARERIGRCAARESSRARRVRNCSATKEPGMSWAMRRLFTALGSSLRRRIARSHRSQNGCLCADAARREPATRSVVDGAPAIDGLMPACRPRSSSALRSAS
jgi:hypothetical protein